MSPRALARARAQSALAVLLVLSAGGLWVFQLARPSHSRPAEPALFTGERWVIVGDSLASGAAGAALVLLMDREGAETHTISPPGQPPADVRADTATWTAVRSIGADHLVFVLGTNDCIRLSRANDRRAALAEIEASIRGLLRGVPSAWLVGPPSFAARLSWGAECPAVIDIERRVFGDRFIDATRFTSDEGRTSDDVHFDAAGGEAWAASVATALSHGHK